MLCKNFRWQKINEVLLNIWTIKKYENIINFFHNLFDRIFSIKLVLRC
jgi:hypothetical protein